MPTTKTCSAVTTDCVDFVDEDDAGSILLSLLEKVAYAAGADADEHLDKVRTRDGEERYVGLAGYGARQEGFTGTRRSDQQHSLGNTTTQLLELLCFAQKLDDFLQLFLGLIHTGHIFEGDLLLLHGEQAGTALAEGQCLVASALHLAQHKEPQSRDHDDRSEIEEDR